MAKQKRVISEALDRHDDSLMMIPPPGFKFIPKNETVCGKAGCFECFDIYCERCESKDRRIVELEMRNNDLVKYVTQLQGQLFGTRQMEEPNTFLLGGQQRAGAATLPASRLPNAGGVMGGAGGKPGGPGTSEPFAYVQSPVLYDPNMNMSYIATTSFSPAPHDAIAAANAPKAKPKVKKAPPTWG
eukprot:GHVN01079993.1.p1 GENE.GHVN01079993.1~~GHVN01079993.1.p1  ORF type:complete len:205 (+),score=30.19 GHVN01079993.1:60-617(+)